MSHRKRVTPPVWCISNADGEQVERGTGGGAVNILNQSKLSDTHHCYTRGQIYKTNNMDLGTPLVTECSNLKWKSFVISSEALCSLAKLVIENGDVFGTVG